MLGGAYGESAGLAGAIGALEVGRTPRLISYASEGATSDAQATIFEALKTNYRGRAFDRCVSGWPFPTVS